MYHRTLAGAICRSCVSTALPHFFGSAGDVFLRGSHLIRGAGTQVSSCNQVLLRELIVPELVEHLQEPMGKIVVS
jgi:hypothetical protein